MSDKELLHDWVAEEVHFENCCLYLYMFTYRSLAIENGLNVEYYKV